MKTLPLKIATHGARILPLLTLAASLQFAVAGESDSNAAEQEQRKNLARFNVGASVETSSGVQRAGDVALAAGAENGPAALLTDDQTLSCALREGESSFVVNLARISSLRRITFINENGAARGQLRIAVSNYHLAPSSPKWSDVDGAVPFSGKRQIELSLCGVEAKFVKLSFQVEKAGRIAALGVYGEERLAAFAPRSSGVPADGGRSVDGATTSLSFNYANLYAKSAVVFVSSGSRETAERMIDDNPATAFRFAAGDAHPTAVIRLGAHQQLSRLAVRSGQRAVRLDVYLTDKLGRRPDDLTGLAVAASVLDRGDGKAALNFEARGAQFVILRWTPEGESGGDERDFEVMDVSAFGNAAPAMLVQSEAPTQLDTMLALNLSVPPTFAGAAELTTGLGTVAEPPVISMVSP